MIHANGMALSFVKPELQGIGEILHCGERDFPLFAHVTLTLSFIYELDQYSLDTECANIKFLLQGFQKILSDRQDIHAHRHDTTEIIYDATSWVVNKVNFEHAVILSLSLFNCYIQACLYYIHTWGCLQVVPISIYFHAKTIMQCHFTQN